MNERYSINDEVGSHDPPRSYEEDLRKAGVEADFASSRLMEPGQHDAKPSCFRFAVTLARMTAPVE